MTPWWKKVRAAAKSAQLTNAQIAEKIGVTDSAVGHWLRGAREPSNDTIRQLCEIVGISVTEAMSDDPYWVTNPVERELLDLWRSMTEVERAALALITKRKA